MQYYLVRNPTKHISSIVKKNGVIFDIEPHSDWIIVTDVDLKETPRQIQIKRQINYEYCPCCGTDDTEIFEAIPEFGVFFCYDCEWESDDMLDSVWVRTRLKWTKDPLKLSSPKP